MKEIFDLIEMDPNDLASLIFNIKLLREGTDIISDVLKRVYVKDWTQEEIKIKFEFKEPLDISSSYKKD